MFGNRIWRACRPSSMFPDSHMSSTSDDSKRDIFGRLFRPKLCLVGCVKTDVLQPAVKLAVPPYNLCRVPGLWRQKIKNNIFLK